MRCYVGLLQLTINLNLSIAKAIHAEGLAPVQAERERVVELQHTGERYVPFDLVRLG